MNEDNNIFITICGDGGCGKSSITLRLVKSKWTNEYDPTIEDSYSVERRVDGRTYLLHLTDTAGQEEYRGLWTASTLKADAFLLVYDITNPASVTALDEFKALVEMETDNRMSSGAVPPVKIVAGNKCDLSHERKVTAQTGLQWARENNCGFMETSAREMVNVEETFELLIRRVVESRRQAAAGVKPEEIKQPDAPLGGSSAPAVPTKTGKDKPLPAPKDKQSKQSQAEDGDERKGGLVGLLKRFKCW